MSDQLNIGPVKNQRLMKKPELALRPIYYCTIFEADMPVVDCWADTEDEAKRLAESLVSFMRAGRGLCAWSE